MVLEKKVLAFSPELKVGVREVRNKSDDGKTLTLAEVGEEENQEIGEFSSSHDYYFDDQSKARALVKRLQLKDQVLVVELGKKLLALYGPLMDGNFYARTHENH